MKKRKEFKITSYKPEQIRKTYLNINIFLNKKKYITLSIILSIILSSTIVFKKYWSNTDKQKKDYITIFTHGSFGSVIGLMNLFQVLKGNINGTKYKKTITKMRKNPIFYKSQPILQRGLIKIKPSFDISTTSSARFAAYPILKAYEKINKQFLSKNVNNSFYTFGWSGLISQERRRKEAIRFYNALSEELEKYQNKPKIRILAHSHGGNIALNLSAIHKVINNYDNMDEILKQSINKDEKETLTLMYEEIKKLPKKEDAKKLNGQKVFDYKPTNTIMKINELLMFGTPIQPETECLILTNFFGKIYNIYSNEDIIQDIDVFSTRKCSSQRLKILEKIPPKITDIPQVIQLKIMVDRNIKKITNKNKTKVSTLIPTNAPQKRKSPQSFWEKLFSINRFTPKKTKDPTHKEMWFVSWNKLQKNEQATLESIPSVIFTPLFLKAIKKINKQTNDIDLNIKLTDKNLNVYVLKHSLEEEQKVQYKVSINRNIVDSIKNKLLKWIPDDLSFTKEFNIIKNYQEQI